MSDARHHLHFVQSIEPLQGGGLGRAALELHDAMIAAGASSQLVATCGEHPQATGRSDVSEFPRRGPAKVYFAPALRPAARELVERADIVHAHGFYVATNWLLGREARRQQRPLVSHAHGFFEPWILGRSRLRKRAVHLLFETANFRATRLWRALTSKEADQIRAQGITAPIVVAPNGIHLDAFSADTPEIRESRWNTKARHRLLFLARLHPKKGLDLLIPAWAQMRAGERGWELIVAGPDEENHRSVIESLVRERGIAGSVSFPGTVGGADKIALLRSADAFILPSYSEGFSVAILEAMAARVPVAATHACNFPELARDGGGWLCEPTIDAVTAQLEQILASPDRERAERGAAGHALVVRKYTWPSIARVILDACDQYC